MNSNNEWKRKFDDFVATSAIRKRGLARYPDRAYSSKIVENAERLFRKSLDWRPYFWPSYSNLLKVTSSLDGYENFEQFLKAPTEIQPDLIEIALEINPISFRDYIYCLRLVEYSESSRVSHEIYRDKIVLRNWAELSWPDSPYSW
jgi:hypothetical protein